MKTIITGGAGFIGSNASSRYLKRGHQVVVVDNLARDGVGENLEWLRSQGRARVPSDRRSGLGRHQPRFPRASRCRSGAASGGAGGRDYLGARSPRGFRDQRAGHFQRAGGHAAVQHAGAADLFVHQQSLRRDDQRGRRGTQRPLRLSIAAHRRFRGTQSRLSLARTVAPKDRPTSTSSTITASTGCAPPSSANPAFMDTASSAPRIRAGWRGL